MPREPRDTGYAEVLDPGKLRERHRVATSDGPFAHISRASLATDLIRATPAIADLIEERDLLKAVNEGLRKGDELRKGVAA